MGDWVLRPLDSVRTLVEMGGDVLYALFLVTFVMWSLLMERFWYLYFVHPRHMRWVEGYWKGRADRYSWRAHQIRNLLLADSLDRARQKIPMIDTLVKLCPLLGLLGTVTGMIAIFDVMAFSGTGNARAMAAGVSKATIPTMVGIATSLSGLTVIARLNQRVKQADQSLNETLLVAEKR